MNEEEKEILNAIETSFLASEIEGARKRFEHKYLKGIITPKSAALSHNCVQQARIPENEVEKTIQEVINEFKKYEVKKIGWLCSPLTEPSDLQEKLESFGFVEEITQIGMYKTIDEEFDVPITDEFDFKTLTEQELFESLSNESFRRFIETAYGYPFGAADVIYEKYRQAETINDVILVAYNKNNDEPAGVTRMEYIKDTTYAKLTGAATLPEYRKRGIYTGMMKLRIEQAKKDGISHLITIAIKNTSTPILRKNGFKEVGDFSIYAWTVQ